MTQSNFLMQTTNESICGFDFSKLKSWLLNPFTKAQTN